MFRSLHKDQKGFTLIELMIVVAIIGILAAIAIPNFLGFQLRSRAGEGKTNLAAVRTAEESYGAEFSTYVGVAALYPRAEAALNTAKDDSWDPAAAGAAGFSTIGWQPEGAVYYSYQVAVGPAGCPAAGTPCTQYTAEAASDIDDDGTTNWWGYVKDDAAGAAIAGTSGICVATGVYNAQTQAQDLLETVGPCNNTAGQSVF